MQKKVQLQDHCDKCRKKFIDRDPITIKVPEWIYFCIDCSEKNIDRGHPGWIGLLYQKGMTLSNKEKEKWSLE